MDSRKENKDSVPVQKNPSTPLPDKRSALPPAEHPKQFLKWLAFSIAILFLALLLAFLIPYHRLSTRIDGQLAAGTWRNTFSYYTAPEWLSPGDPATPADTGAALKRAGYSFSSSGGTIIVESRPPIRIQFAGSRISSLTDLTSGRPLPQFELGPQLITSTNEDQRVRLTVIHYAQLPSVLIQAIVSAEDKRFFEHSGFDQPRILKALYVDVKAERKEQGASTISMQLARNLWLQHDKSWTRKFNEMLATVHLERTLSKQQILEDYCNTVYLGSRGTFGFHGFGQAARAYFNKDVRQLNLTEAATLAGLIQRPSHFDPFRYPGRAVERRNVVLHLMHDNGYISDAQYENALAAPLGLHPGAPDTSQSQYFIDVAADEATRALGDAKLNGLERIYTTLDPRLERAAEQAITDSMPSIDRELASRGKRRRQPQVALIALDPHTGEVKALCGGRNYENSQFDRVFAKRPPGSVFKPFVYTAALNTAITGGSTVWTPLSTIDDSPTTFQFGNKTYTPSNFKNEFWGPVTLRKALAHSLNVATVKLAQQVGFNNVVQVARAAGMNDDIKPTPAVALGAYQVTPFEIARAYTVFADNGSRVQPAFVSEVSDPGGRLLYSHVPNVRPALDPRVAYLMVDMLEEVMRSGTAAGVRARGFYLPAAGKTGTSHDGWFAGFTSQLLCVVWVGFDDYTDLDLEGAHSALPIWTDFMMRAASYRQYGNAKPFDPPPGVVRVSLDSDTGEVAGPDCPGDVSAYFISGTQPSSQCSEKELDLEFTANGGVTERSMPLRQTPDPDEPPLPQAAPPPIYPPQTSPVPPTPRTLPLPGDPEGRPRP